MRNLNGTEYVALRLRIKDMPAGMRFTSNPHPDASLYCSLGYGMCHSERSPDRPFNCSDDYSTYPVDQLSGKRLDAYSGRYSARSTLA